MARVVPLYPPEEEIAELMFGKGHVREWRQIVPLLERKGLPPVDPLTGRRYFPAVRRFFDLRHGLVSGPGPYAPDGVEDYSCLNNAPRASGGRTWTAPAKPAARPTDQPAENGGAQKIRSAVRREIQEGKRGRGRGDPGIYTADVELRIRDGIRERAKEAEAERIKKQSDRPTDPEP
jgi:hypothetical protein